MSTIEKALKTFENNLKDIDKLKKEFNTKNTDLTSNHDKGLKPFLNDVKANKPTGTALETKLTEYKKLKMAALEAKEEYTKSKDAFLKVLADVKAGLGDTYINVKHSLIDTVYDARTFLSLYNNMGKKTVDKKIEKLKEYLKAYAELQDFNKDQIKELKSKVSDTTVWISTNEGDHLLDAFAKHEKEGLDLLLKFYDRRESITKLLVQHETYIQGKIKEYDFTTLDRTLNDIEVILGVPEEDKPLIDENTISLLCTLLGIDKTGTLTEEKEIEFVPRVKHDVTIPIPLYADPIIQVSIDFSFSMDIGIKGKIDPITYDLPKGLLEVKAVATANMDFTFEAALSLRIIQLIKASIGVRVGFNNVITTEGNLKAKWTTISGGLALNVSSKLAAEAYITLGITGPIGAIIELVTGQAPEKEWSLGSLVLFEMTLKKNASVTLDAKSGKIKAESNFKPLKDGFTIDFIGKEEIKRKLNARYNNQLKVIKQQLLSDTEIAKAAEEKDALLKKNSIFTRTEIGQENYDHTQLISGRDDCVSAYDRYYNIFWIGKAIVTLKEKGIEYENDLEILKIINSYDADYKDAYHEEFIKTNAFLKDAFDANNFFKLVDDNSLASDNPYKKSNQLKNVENIPMDILDDMVKDIRTIQGKTKNKKVRKSIEALYTLKLITIDQITSASDEAITTFKEEMDTFFEKTEKEIEDMIINDKMFSFFEAFNEDRRTKKHELRALLNKTLDAEKVNYKYPKGLNTTTIKSKLEGVVEQFKKDNAEMFTASN
ncbi:MAG: hypothetical protein MK212_14095 [Saprospiraceae bacterium]|nr:hypothetical protein [Saprospiraceae bacterium]